MRPLFSSYLEAVRSADIASDYDHLLFTCLFRDLISIPRDLHREFSLSKDTLKKCHLINRKIPTLPAFFDYAQPKVDSLACRRHGEDIRDIKKFTCHAYISMDSICFRVSTPILTDDYIVRVNYRQVWNDMTWLEGYEASENDLLSKVKDPKDRAILSKLWTVIGSPEKALDSANELLKKAQDEDDEMKFPDSLFLYLPETFY